MNIQEFVSRIKREAGQCRNEEEFRHKFLNAWQELIKDLGYSDSVRIEERITRGKADARFRSLVFEFKNPSVSILSSYRGRADALRELRDHLNQYVEMGSRSEELKGIITDGGLVASLSYDQWRRAFVAVDEFERYVRDESAYMPFGNAELLFDAIIFGLTKRELTPQNLVEEFGPASEVCRRAVPALWDLLDRGLAKPRVHAFYETWKLLFSLSTKKVATGKDLAETLEGYGLSPGQVSSEEDARKFLFTIHTYYSLLLKFLAFGVADELKLFGTTQLLEQIKRDAIGGLELAERVLPGLVVNVVEKDVFSWFEDVWDQELAGIIKLLGDKVSNYDLRGVRRDVLKRVYQHLVPAQLRKSLGEFYTKDWTAEMLLDALGYRGEGRILDPACGSGTFLVLAIERIRERHHDLQPPELLRKVMASVVGFDVNPIAVMTARINYLLATYDLIKETGGGGIEIPIYLCDSVSIPHEAYDIPSNGLVYEIQFPDKMIGTFRLPKDPQVLRLLQILERNVSRKLELFLSDVEAELGADFALKYKTTLRSLHAKMMELDKKGVNEIWCRFLSNFFHPLIVEPFDYVVGNPPWVAPERVPKEYRDKIYDMVKRSGFLEPYLPHFAAVKAHFAGAEEQYAACLAFFPRTFQNYLRKGGRLAFLLTSSLLTYLNSGGFREQIAKLRLQKIIDLTLYTSIHEGATCWAFIPVIENADGETEDSVQYAFMIPIEEGDSPEAAPKFKTESWNIPKRQLLLDEARPRAPWFVAKPESISVFRKMQNNPRLGDIYNIHMGIKSSANRIYVLRDIEPAEDDLLICKTLDNVQINLEKDIVFPLVTGRNIAAWRFSYEYILVPHYGPDWKPISESRLAKDYPNAYEYLSEKKRKQVLLTRKDYNKKSGPFYMVFRLSSRKVGRCKVAYGKLGTQLQASVVPATMSDKLLGKSKVMMDSSTYFMSLQDAREAYYLAALLNSTLLRAFSYGFGNPKGGVPFRQFLQWNVAILPTPRYDPVNKKCLRLAELSEKAHKQPDAAGLQAEIDSTTAELYGLGHDDVQTLKEHYAMLSGKIR